MDTPEEQAWAPCHLGATFRETFRLFGRHPLSILLIGCLPWIAVDAVAAFLGVGALGWEELNQGFPAALKRPLLRWALYLLVTTFAVSPLVEGALTQALSEAYIQPSLSIRRAYRRAFRRWGALMGIHLLVGCLCVGIFAGVAGGAYLLAFFLLPESWQTWKPFMAVSGGTIISVVYWLRWSLVVPVVFLEGMSPGQALARSRELTQGYRLPIFGVVVVGTGFSWILNAGMQWLGIGAETGVSLGNGLAFIALPLVYLGRRVSEGGYTPAELADALERET